MTVTSEELGEDAAREGEEGDATMPAQDDAFETVIREKVAEALATAGARREAATQQAGELRALLTEAALRVEARFTQAERASGDRPSRTLQMAHRTEGDREVYILAWTGPGPGGISGCSSTSTTPGWRGTGTSPTGSRDPSARSLRRTTGPSTPSRTSSR